MRKLLILLAIFCSCGKDIPSERGNYLCVITEVVAIHPNWMCGYPKELVTKVVFQDCYKEDVEEFSRSQEWTRRVYGRQIEYTFTRTCEVSVYEPLSNE